MEYVWMIMLAIADLLWIIASIADVIHAIKDKRRFDPVTKGCIVANLMFLFLVSFFMWLFSH